MTGQLEALFIGVSQEPKMSEQLPEQSSKVTLPEGR
jgi:hypothetical protein